MLGTLIRAMEAEREPLRCRWETLLRSEPVCSPLADPDILIFKIDETCETALQRLRNLKREKNKDTEIVQCGCGLNPLLRFFATGEMAMMETLLRVIHGIPRVSLLHRRQALGDLVEVWDKMRSEEVEAFCSMCCIKQRDLKLCGMVNQVESRSR